MGDGVAEVQALAPRAILVVDDAPSNLIAYRAVLESLGREIVTAASGEEATQLLARQPFSLLLDRRPHAGHGRIRDRGAPARSAPRADACHLHHRRRRRRDHATCLRLRRGGLPGQAGAGRDPARKGSQPARPLRPGNRAGTPGRPPDGAASAHRRSGRVAATKRHEHRDPRARSPKSARRDRDRCPHAGAASRGARKDPPYRGAHQSERAPHDGHDSRHPRLHARATRRRDSAQASTDRSRRHFRSR